MYACIYTYRYVHRYIHVYVYIRTRDYVGYVVDSLCSSPLILIMAAPVLNPRQAVSLSGD